MKKVLLLSVFIFSALSLTSQDHTSQKGQKVKISTVLGDIIVLLYDDTPLHRDNFIAHVKAGNYNGTIFHRVIQNFMIQGGDFNSIGAAQNQTLGVDNCKLIPNEIRSNHFHKKGALASARLPDSVNKDRKSSGCQFYIVQGYKHSDAQLNNMENQNYKFPDINRAFYKVRGGYPTLDIQYTIFGEVIEGLEIIDLISAMPTGKFVKDRPNSDIKMTMSLIN